MRQRPEYAPHAAVWTGGRPETRKTSAKRLVLALFDPSVRALRRSAAAPPTPARPFRQQQLAREGF